jgi:cytochrome P450
MIDERRRSSEVHGDLLSRLLEAKDDDGAPMSDRQTRDEILTLFVAGHETTATGLAWTIHEACKNPKIYAEMEREADAVGDSPTIADLGKLDTCLRAFKEALRIYPPVYMFGRDATTAVELGGYDLPRSTNVMISPWVMHRQRHVWPDPERFDPERFQPANESKRHRYAYLPFSAGPRFCLGIHFAYIEAPLILATLLRRFRFELLAEDQAEPSATLRPKNGVRVRVHARRP